MAKDMLGKLHAYYAYGPEVYALRARQALAEQDSWPKAWREFSYEYGFRSARTARAKGMSPQEAAARIDDSRRRKFLNNTLDLGSLGL